MYNCIVLFMSLVYCHSSLGYHKLACVEFFSYFRMLRWQGHHATDMHWQPSGVMDVVESKHPWHDLGQCWNGWNVNMTILLQT